MFSWDKKQIFVCSHNNNQTPHHHHRYHHIFVTSWVLQSWLQSQGNHLQMKKDCIQCILSCHQIIWLFFCQSISLKSEHHNRRHVNLSLPVPTQNCRSLSWFRLTFNLAHKMIPEHSHPWDLQHFQNFYQTQWRKAHTQEPWLTTTKNLQCKMLILKTIHWKKPQIYFTYCRYDLFL